MSNADPVIKQYDILSSNGQTICKANARIIREVSLTVNLQDQTIATIACSGINLEELAAGFLKSERLLGTQEEIGEIQIIDHEYLANITLKNENKSSASFIRNIGSSGGRGRTIESSSLFPLSIPDGFTVNPRLALELMEDFLGRAALHRETHGTHCSALVREGKIIAWREDIGRHNTIDMLAGLALLKHIDLSEAFILTTGRISSEIVNKIWNMGIPVIISHSAPTTKAIELTDKAGITLIGYVRSGKMNIYSHERRVKI